MATWRSSEDPQKIQINTALYTGHTHNRAPAGLELFLGGQAGGELAENTMVRAQVGERPGAGEMTAALTVWNLTVQAENKTLKGIRWKHGVSRRW